MTSKYKPQTNTPLLAQRNAAICTNRFCTSLKEYPVDTEFCPDCKKRLTKTVAGLDQFVSV